MNQLLKSLKSVPRGSKSGFALGVSLVIVVVVVTIAGGLALNREMWAQSGTKQLHRIVSQAALEADTAAILAAIRTGVAEDGIFINEEEDFFAESPLFQKLEGSSLLSAVSVDGSPVTYTGSYEVAVSEEADPEEPLAPLPTFFDSVDGLDFSGSLTRWDPFGGVNTQASGIGLMVNREVVGDLREGKDAAETSKLQAWSEVDVAKYMEVIFRWMPASIFTVYYPSPVSGSNPTLMLGTLAAGGGNPIGRYYVEGKVAPSATVGISSPLIATEGLDWDSSLWASSGQFLTYASGSGGTQLLVGKPGSGSAGRDAFYRESFLLYPGLYELGGARPTSLFRENGRNSVVSTNLVDSNNILGDYYTNASVRVTRSTPDEVLVEVADGVTLPSNFADAFSVDDDSNLIVFDSSVLSYDGLGTPPFVIYVASGGDDEFGNPLSGSQISSYSVVARVDSVGGLSSDSTLARMTLVSPHSLILEGGFNGSSPTAPAMVVSPDVQVSSPSGATSSPASVPVNGVVLTRVGDPFRAIDAVGVHPPLAVNLNGSMLAWEVDPLIADANVNTTISPSTTYLDGSNYPPGVPALMDVRMGRESLENYRIFSTEPLDQ